MSKLYFNDANYKEYIDNLLLKIIGFEVNNLISRNIKNKFFVDELKLRDSISYQLNNDSSLQEEFTEIDMDILKKYIVVILTRYIKALTMGLKAEFSDDMMITLCTLIVRIESKEGFSNQEFIEVYLDSIVKLVKQFKKLVMSLETFTNLMIFDLTIDNLN